jgi:membrane protein YdbS with pleckstrin-like domain
MSQRIKSRKARRSRGFTYLWILALAVGTFLLIYFEQTSLLYILATLGVTVLLVVVALADLGQSELSPDRVQMSDIHPPGVKRSN